MKSTKKQMRRETFTQGEGKNEAPKLVLKKAVPVNSVSKAVKSLDVKINGKGKFVNAAAEKGASDEAQISNTPVSTVLRSAESGGIGSLVKMIDDKDASLEKKKVDEDVSLHKIEVIIQSKPLHRKGNGKCDQIQNSIKFPKVDLSNDDKSHTNEKSASISESKNAAYKKHTWTPSSQKCKPSVNAPIISTIKSAAKLQRLNWCDKHEHIIRSIFLEYKEKMDQKKTPNVVLKKIFENEIEQFCKRLREDLALGKKNRMIYLMDHDLEFDNIFDHMEHNATELLRRSIAIVKAKSRPSYLAMSVLFPERKRFSDAPKTPELFRKLPRRAYDTNIAKWKRSIYTFIEKYATEAAVAEAIERVQQCWTNLTTEYAESPEKNEKTNVSHSFSSSLNWSMLDEESEVIEHKQKVKNAKDKFKRADDQL